VVCNVVIYSVVVLLVVCNVVVHSVVVLLVVRELSAAITGSRLGSQIYFGAIFSKSNIDMITWMSVSKASFFSSDFELSQCVLLNIFYLPANSKSDEEPSND
jgi:hypothetical protein